MAQVTFRPASSTTCCVPLTDLHACHVTLRLLQQRGVWFACVPDQTSTVAVRLMFSIQHSEHVTPGLDWLHVSKHIHFKLSVLKMICNDFFIVKVNCP